MNESILPSKQFIITVIVITVLLGGGIAVFLSTRESASKFFAESNEKEMREIAEKLVASDEDEDGLLDWEESLWKTDVKNPDTDSDGTSDGEEIRIGRDPLKPTPGDEITVQSIEVFRDTAVTDAQIKNSNLTAEFAKNFFVEYAKTKEAGLPVGIMGASIEKVENLIPQDQYENREPLFTEEDILIAPSEDNYSLREYGNAVGRAFENHPVVGENMLDVLYRALRSGNKAELDKLRDAASSVGLLAEEIISIRVPEPLVENHLDLLNALAFFNEILVAFGNTYEDPLGATIAMTYYPKTAKELAIIGISTAKYLESRNIVYTRNDPGHVFNELLVIYKRSPNLFI